VTHHLASSFLASVLLVATTLVACSSDDAPAARNGVNDVRKACEIRTTWTKPTSSECIACQAAAQTAACDCVEFKEWGGLCQSQEDARRAEPTCTDDLRVCTTVCAKTDCGCVEACYAKAEQCKKIIAARDGCVADVCTKPCQ
jgi:hypothetical protein